MVQLAFFEGLSHATIAARTNLPIGTVKSRLRLAFSRLRRLLHEAGVTGAIASCPAPAGHPLNHIATLSFRGNRLVTADRDYWIARRRGR